MLLLGEEAFGRGRAEYIGIAEMIVRDLAVQGNVRPNPAFRQEAPLPVVAAYLLVGGVEGLLGVGDGLPTTLGSLVLWR